MGLENCCILRIIITERTSLIMNRNLLTPLILPALLGLLILFASESRGGGRQWHLQWTEPLLYPVSEEEYLESLHFRSARYTDSLPHVPVVQHRVRESVPHFSHSFRLEETSFVPVSDREDELLRQSDFFPGSVRVIHETQMARKDRYTVVTVFPFRYDAQSDRYEKLAGFSLTEELAYDPGLSHPASAHYAESSVLAQGSWYKLCVEETGIHRLGYEDLQELGINPSTVQRQHLRLFGNGSGMLPEANSEAVIDDLKENAIYVSGQGSGTFGADDYILFYGRSPNTWHAEQLEATGDEGEGDGGSHVFRHRMHLYATASCYFLTTDQGQGKRIGVRENPGDTPTHEVSTFRDYALHQRDLDNLLGSGRVWFGEVFDATLGRQFSFDFPNMDTSTPAILEYYLAARSPIQSTFTIGIGSQQQQVPIQAINVNDYNGFFVRVNNDFMPFYPDHDSQLTVSLQYNRPGSGTRGWLNYLAVNVDRQLVFSGGQMAFRQVDHLGADKMVEYVLSGAGSGVQVWDVSDRFNIVQQQSSQQGSVQRFRQSGEILREFVAFDGSSFLEPLLHGAIPNQDLHGLQARDLVILSPPDFLPAAERLADYRRDNDGLSVHVVTTDQVYNEFSSGTADISAIRNFMRMFYDRADNPQETPSYLLLFGNGTYDNKDLLGYGGNLIPTYQSYGSISLRNTYMTDDYFGLLDANEGQDAFGVVDIGIGRFPVRSLEEAEMLVDKTIRYQERVPGLHPMEDHMEYTGTVSNYADWRNRVVFVADDGDSNTHFNDAEDIAATLMANHPEYNVQKIYLDAYQQVTMAGGQRYPEVNRAINEAVNQGALMINYIGHGGKRGLAHQRVLTFEDIASWNNTYNMPVFMTATCEFSSFDHPDPDDLYAGVRIVLKPEGGTVALFTTTRLAWSGNNKILNSNFMETAFETDEMGRHHRMGDLMRIAKTKSSGASVPMQLRNFVLLGDPSMQMAYPGHRVVTEALPDTLRAYQEVTVSGHVTDIHGNPLDDYHGVIYPTIYDKEVEVQTLGNNTGSIPASFKTRNSILYKGKASIENGAFSFSFIVPRDIAYAYGSGRISYYFDDGERDGHGYHEDFTIGGTLDDFTPDHEGPVIDLYMNDTTFVSGDHTNENPVLLALLYDESGINMTGSIGHDIVAFLNENTNEPIRLTHYYQADMDTYQSGRVVYPFYGLEDGRHVLSLRAWDTHNNPSTASIEFVVTSSGTVVLEDLMNYPNPFSDETWFTFKHNQAFSELDVRIDIYDLQGRLVNTIRERVGSAGFQATPIRWDGISNDGRPLGNGLYLYRLTMKTPDGQQARQAERLVIFR